MASGAPECENDMGDQGTRVRTFMLSDDMSTAASLVCGGSGGNAAGYGVAGSRVWVAGVRWRSSGCGALRVMCG